MFLSGQTEKKHFLDSLVKKHILLISGFLLSFCFSTTIFAQEKTKIKIERAGFFEKDKNKYPDASVLTRDKEQKVLISHDGVLMTCNQAFFYEEKNFIEAFGEVSLKQGDTLNLKANYLEYNGDTKLVYAEGNVILNEPESNLYTESLYFDRNKQEAFYSEKGKLIRNLSDTIYSLKGTFFANEKKYRFETNVDLRTPKYNIYSDILNYFTESGKSYFSGPTDIITDDSKIYCEFGYYDTMNDNGYFIKNSKIDFEEYQINGDSIYFDRSINYASATNNIRILDTINKTLSTGHYAEIHRDIDSMFIQKRALIASFKEKDTTYIHGESIIITGKENEQIIRAFMNGKILRNNLSGKCDSIHFNQITGIAQLINKQKNSEIRSKKVKKPILWNNKSQITGDSIHIKFNIENNIIETLVLPIDDFFFTSVIQNLLDNAKKYSSEEDAITIESRIDSSHVSLSFIDKGIGVPEKEKTKIFEQFYRVEDEETRSSKGTGLGLYLVNEIVKMHGAKILCKNNSPKGSIFTIQFKLDNVKKSSITHS